MTKLTTAEKLELYRKTEKQYEQTNDPKLEAHRRLIARLEAEQ